MENTKARIITSTKDKEKRKELTREDYERKIPPCCSYRTIEQHEDIGLCWSLATRVQLEKPITGMCDECTENSVSPFAINRMGP